VIGRPILLASKKGSFTMIDRSIHLTRRTAVATGAAALAMPAVVRAQGEPIRLATLTPLTGAGGSYGPLMAKAAAAVVEDVNKAGGVLGRRV
jgi:branched-chain amino acid transport system substrate-binding protein